MACNHKSMSQVRNRHKKLQLWEDDAMVRTMNAVVSGRMGIIKVLWNMLYHKQLKDKLIGSVVYGT